MGLYPTTICKVTSRVVGVAPLPEEDPLPEDPLPEPELPEADPLPEDPLPLPVTVTPWFQKYSFVMGAPVIVVPEGEPPPADPEEEPLIDVEEEPPADPAEELLVELDEEPPADPEPWVFE